MIVVDNDNVSMTTEDDDVPKTAKYRAVYNFHQYRAVRVTMMSTRPPEMFLGFCCDRRKDDVSVTLEMGILRIFLPSQEKMVVFPLPQGVFTIQEFGTITEDDDDVSVTTGDIKYFAAIVGRR